MPAPLHTIRPVFQPALIRVGLRHIRLHNSSCFLMRRNSSINVSLVVTIS
jgi:hypothetical protein